MKTCWKCCCYCSLSLLTFTPFAKIWACRSSGVAVTELIWQKRLKYKGFMIIEQGLAPKEHLLKSQFWEKSNGRFEMLGNNVPVLLVAGLLVPGSRCQQSVQLRTPACCRCGCKPTLGHFAGRCAFPSLALAWCYVKWLSRKCPKNAGSLG